MELTIPFERYELANGLQVVLMVDHALPQVVVDTWYRVGSKDEAVGRSGFAHLFEHLMFMGTFRLPDSGFDQVMEAQGGWNNAWTMEDATNYYDVGPANLLETFLWMEADRMQKLGEAMTGEKLALQRDVVRNERRQSNEDRPYGMVEIELTTALYPAGHPYAHSVIGSHEDLEAATTADVQGFFNTWYVPNNASLVVAGDFDPAQARVWVDRYFGGITRRDLPARAVPAPVSAPQKLSVQISDQVEFPQLNLFWHSPGKFKPGDAELAMVAELLGTGESARLYTKLVDAGLAQEIGVSRTPIRDALRQLEADGLVTIQPRLGASVTKLDLKIFGESCGLRLALESHAAGLAARTRSDADLQEIGLPLEEMRRITDELVVSGDLERLLPLLVREDVRFHLAIITAARNDLIKKEILRLHLVNRVVTGPAALARAKVQPEPPEDMSHRRAVFASHEAI